MAMARALINASCGFAASAASPRESTNSIASSGLPRKSSRNGQIDATWSDAPHHSAIRQS
jgi:hypothetical protein